MPTIHILGDSLAATKSMDQRPKTGWGDVLDHFLPEDYTVMNHAVNDVSTQSFIALGYFEHCMNVLKPHDLVLISFGENDHKKEDLSRYTEPFGSYQDYLRVMVTNILSKHAKPILITPITKRAFIWSHTIDQNTLGDYPYAMLELAKTLKIPCIDLFTTSQVILATLGEDASKALYCHLKPNEHPNYPLGVEDDIHLNHHGAEVMASILVLELKKYL